MNKSEITLLRTLLLSTSGRNTLKYSHDKKKRSSIIGSRIGIGIIYLMIVSYAIATCIGFDKIGQIDRVPLMCAMIISVLSFVLAFMRTNGYLFNFREYDMLMSYPFKARSVAKCKFLCMYIGGLPWFMSISLASLIGYGIFGKPSVIVYPVWIVLSFVLPIIPMLAASFIGFLIARMSTGFKNKTIIQAIFTMLFVLLIILARYIIEAMFRNDEVEEVLKITASTIDGTGKFYPPVRWFSDAVTKMSFTGMLLLLGTSALLFAILFVIVGNSYAMINSSLKSHATSKKYRVSSSKKRSVANAVAFKEFKRMTGSSTYLVNAGFGVVLSVLMGIAFLIFGFDKIVSVVTQNAPFSPSILYPSIPFIVYFFIGMISTTAFTPSLEGRNYWIVTSLPIEKETLYKGKLLFNMYLMAPASLFTTLCICISARLGIITTILCMILGLSLVFFSSALGCVCGIRFMRLDWENEVEIIKKSTAVTVYMLPNMFINMGVIVLAVIVGKAIGIDLFLGISIIPVLLLGYGFYLLAMSLASKRG